MPSHQIGAETIHPPLCRHVVSLVMPSHQTVICRAGGAPAAEVLAAVLACLREEARALAASLVWDSTDFIEASRPPRVRLRLS